MKIYALIKGFKNWSRVEIQKLTQFYENTWIQEKGGLILKVPSLVLLGPTHHFLYGNSRNWNIVLFSEHEPFIQQALEINNNWIHDMCMYRPSLSFDISSPLVFEKIIDIFNDSLITHVTLKLYIEVLIKLLGSMQDKEKVFEFQGWSNMIFCLQSDLMIPKKIIDLLYEWLQSQLGWNKSFFKILNEHSSEKYYVVFLKGSVKDSDGIAKKNWRGVYEIEGENIAGIGYGSGNFKTTFLPTCLKVHDHEQGLKYGQNHYEKTHMMVDAANELDSLLVKTMSDDIFSQYFGSLLPNGKKLNVYSWSSLVDRNDLFSTALVETLAQFWNTMMGGLEGMKTRLDFGMMPLHAFIHWDSGELNFPIATTTSNYCWSGLFICHGWFNFVFDRGKFDGCKTA
jgi:hypothetical protein